MKVAFPGINHIFDCSKFSEVSSLVIKNPILLRNIIDDINAQMRGETGKFVVSSDDKPLVTEKYLELQIATWHYYFIGCTHCSIPMVENLHSEQWDYLIIKPNWQNISEI